MGARAGAVPEEWRALFEGRNVVFAELPPAPPRAVSRVSKWFLRGLALIVSFGAAVGASMWIAAASGRWWIGLIVFVIIGWVATLPAVGIVGAVKVEREAEARRRARALEDPIGRLLPNRGMRRRQFLDPATYAGLLALEQRPVLVFDKALFEVIQLDRMVRSLAPRGRLPEPEILATSSVPAGTSVFGLMLIFQSTSSWVQLLGALRSGAPLHWSLWYSVPMVAVGLYLIVRDPWLRRKLNLPRLFGADAVIGAGWIRDGKGEVWTVDDAMLLVTLAGGGMEIRLLKPGKVRSFYLPMMLGKPGTGRTKAPRGITGLGLRRRAKGLAVDAAKGAAQSVGVETGGDAETDMPGPDDPLRLLLSSWTYPEPRTDLAMRE